MRGDSTPSHLLKTHRNLLILIFALGGGRNVCAAENLQAFVTQLLAEKAGAVIVSDPRTGRIMAVVNPQLAFKEAYPPGSTAKIVTSAAALEEGVIAPQEKIMCRRVPRLLGEAYHCSHPPARAPFDLSAALANSCNYFFSELSARLSRPALAHWYGTFGFGAVEGEPSPGEVNIPDQPREKALAALGEQGVTATPSQVLLAYSAIAEKGRVFDLVMPGQRGGPRLNRVISLRPGTLAVLSEGLRECVEMGSCRAAAIPGVSVAGKTGTAGALDGSRVTHAWFVGYAPADAPEIALVIFLKRGTGGADAAPLAAQILHRYFAAKPHTP